MKKRGCLFYLHVMMLLISAVLGLLSVILGAYIAHGVLGASQKLMHNLTTALNYHQLYAMMSFLILLYSISLKQRSCLLLFASACFIVGIVLFSFGIYGANLWHIDSALHFTPIGGSLFMLGWLILCLYIVRLLKIKP
ncbi:DUF423 domain-containing protein [Fangia hongkongensis]|nr:DUF423 domain-containing protein [Fangia hongkongensis]MBK2125959.1 DUF423 domain-containing protein [Fangia hongkongensis]